MLGGADEGSGKKNGAVGVIRMNSGKGNAMGRDFLVKLNSCIDEAEASDVRAVVLTGHSGFFSVGMALPELLPLSRKDMETFLDDVGSTFARILNSPLPFVAAMNGHAVAGGCILALYCDYRVCGGGPWRIGFSEVQIGLGLPPFITDVLRQAVTKSADWVAVAHRGRMMSPKEAQSMGLIDEVVLGDRVNQMALHRATLLANRPPLAFAQIKREYRRPALLAMAVDLKKRNGDWLDTWFSDDAQELLARTVKRIGG